MKRALLFSSLLSVLISVSLLAQASVTLSPSSNNFGSTPVGTGTAWFTFTLSNSGTSAVSISNVTVSGPFVVSSNCTSSVAANSSCPIYVYFAPTASGAASGTLTVTDAASNSPQTASLSGTGGSGASCTTTPSAPTGLAASGTTSSGTNLSWTADTPPANCTISGYTVLKNGASIGTATGTTFAVTGLSASTAYSFTVEATDGNGTSGASSAVNVTTLANSLHDQAECTHRISGLWHDQLRYKPQLDSGHCSRELHHQQLHRIAERNLDRNRNRHILRGERSFRFDRL